MWCIISFSTVSPRITPFLVLVSEARAFVHLGKSWAQIQNHDSYLSTFSRYETEQRTMIVLSFPPSHLSLPPQQVPPPEDLISAPSEMALRSGGAMAIMIKAGNAIPPKRSLPTSNSTSYLLMDLSIELSRTPSWPQAARSETDHGIQLCFVLAYIPFLR
ncbi:hypothetical protein FRC19_003100 [Serendipita sp. 401]|nr:hypothetical protein FRC19_003100 [Serendipita sp. 401]KAG9024482.1 hypothetical protein FS842_005469 [Serendipita sp. 407]